MLVYQGACTGYDIFNLSILILNFILDRISLFYWIRMDTIESRDLFELSPLRRVVGSH